MENISNIIKKEGWMPLSAAIFVAIIYISKEKLLLWFDPIGQAAWINLAIMTIFPIILLMVAARDFNRALKDKDERELYHEYLLSKLSYFFLVIVISVYAIFSLNIYAGLLLFIIFLMRIIIRNRIEQNY